MLFAFAGDTPVLELPRSEGLELLQWLGLGRPEFGAIEVRVLLPLCNRRLWPEPRNEGALRRHVGLLAARIASRLDALLHFG
jgi:hypothetical protein